MRKTAQRGLSCLLALALALGLVGPMGTSEALALEEPSNRLEYVVKEDAYVRSKSTEVAKNFDSELIRSDHGAQYVGKDLKVINSKYDTEEIIAIMKFDLPTKAEITEKQLDTFEFVFNIFKNANPATGNQTYMFRYTTENDWTETAITWANKPAGINRDSTNVLFDFNIASGYEYETKTDAEKRIRRDITKTVEDLVATDHTQITVFVTAKNKMNTSLMFHSKETSPTNAAGKPARIIAYNKGLNLDGLKALVAQYETVKSSDYTTASFALFSEKLAAAQALIVSTDPSVEAVKTAYRDLEGAYQALVTKTDPNDPSNIAYQRPTRGNFSKPYTYKVTDGDLSTVWSSNLYPAYVDIDLMDTYDLTKVKLYFPAGKKCFYTLYGSNDGKDYDELYQKRDLNAATADGDEIAFPTVKSYRIIRVYLEYTQGENNAYLAEVKAYGTKKNSNAAELRKGTLEEILGAKAHSETDYAKPITEDEIKENVYGIIDRTIGVNYRNWFSFEIAANAVNDNDYFELSDKDGKIHIKGNEGLSIATGLNYYYKNYVNVHISEQTMQVSMPASLVAVGTAVRKETPHKVRYAFNYCTLSYTFAFFGEEDWQKENDWLALNGVNVVLDLAGQEATWIKFLMNFGYSFDDAKDWLTGPAYYAWQFMDNMESFGGPIPDGYVIDRIELARNTQRWKNSLGMQTIMQGYAGMVPTNFNEYQPTVTTIPQGGWNGQSRPSMLATDSQTYKDYSKLFYAAQEFVYGKGSHYYAVDPFHEGGKRPAGLTDATISEKVLDSLLEYDQDAVWVVQGWQSNPTNDLLKGMGTRREDHVLIVDLIKYPLLSWKKYDKLTYDSTTLDAIEFNGTSWAWGLLANFGGNPSMHGQMQVMVDDILSARKKSQHMVGLGIISEAQHDNPIMYDLIFDLAWADDTFSLTRWMEGYIRRRYGGISANAKEAWRIMKDANYDHGVRFTNEVFGAKNKTPQAYGAQNIPYGADKLETAFRLLIADFDQFKDSECYRYDLTELMRQLVSNYAVLTYNDVLTAKDAKNLESFKANKQKFLKAFEVLNEVQATQKEQLGGEWIGKAQDRAKDYDDFSKSAFEMNAKALITSWASGSGMSSLKDYGWRNYEGIFKDIYMKVWSEYLDKVEGNLEFGTPVAQVSVSGYFELYWNWNLSKQSYTRTAKNTPADLQNAIQLVLDNCMLSSSLDPNAGNLALKRTASVNTKDVTGKLRFVTDGLADTKFTARTTTQKPEFVVDLIGEFEISKINLLLDSSKGKWYNYELSYSTDGTVWKKMGEKTTPVAQTEEGDSFPIKDITARYIKVAVTKDSESTEQPELTVNELRVYGSRVLPSLVQLVALVEVAKKLDTRASKPADITRFNAALNTAKDAFERNAPPDEVELVYWTLYEAATALDLSGAANVALNKPVKAMNDPGGASASAVDGSTATSWNSGRLSPTGLPYQHDPITPGWLIVDLQGLYTLEEIKLLFGSANLWYQYEIYAGLGASSAEATWTKVGEKKTETVPNEKEDFHSLDGIKAQYIKLATTNIQNEASGTRRNGYNVAELMVLGAPADYTVTVTFDSKGGSPIDTAQVKVGGTVTRPADPTKEGYTFAGWYTDAQLAMAYNFETAVTGDITLYARWTQDQTQPTPVTGVTLTPGSAGIYVGNTRKLTATVLPGDADDKTVTWSSSDEAVAVVDQNGLVTAVANGTATITVTTVDGGKTATCTVTVSTYVEEEDYTPPTTKTVTKQNEDGSTTRTVTDLKTGTVTETTIWPDGTKIITTTTKDGKSASEVTVPENKDSVTVTIPVKETTPGMVAVIVKPDGTKEIVKTSVATENGIRVTLTKGAKLEIIDNSRRFIDVATEDWFDGAVQFVASRELFNGTTPDTFSPDAPMSRAMLMTVLARLDGQDTNKGETWYSAGMEWAVKNNISDGTSPEQSITREQLAVMLYRYAKAEKSNGNLRAFPDADQVSAYAAEAMAWAVEAGILKGDETGKLNPGGTATRAQVATMLERFLKR